MGMWSLSLRNSLLAKAALVLFGFALSPMVHAQAAANKPVILVVGDSLSAGYGVAVNSTWVALLQRRLSSQGYGHRVVNASVSGETTGGGKARLPRALETHSPDIVILELGGNDALRGLPLQQIRSNLETMIELSRKTGAKVVLLGMQIPPNYGLKYAEGFHALYAELAKKYDVALVDFFLEGVALDEALMQEDGIHPSVEAQARLLENVWPALQTTLKNR
jgi:acyl-CoA thioesterase I